MDQPCYQYIVDRTTATRLEADDANTGLQIFIVQVISSITTTLPICSQEAIRTNMATFNKAPTGDLKTLPLDGLHHTAVSDSDLMSMYNTSPVIWQCGLGSSTKVMRVSQTLVLKGKSLEWPTIEGNLKLASRCETFRVPRVHRIFHFQPADTNKFPGWFTLMDYVPRHCVRDCWEGLDHQMKEKVAGKVARAIVEMQSKRLDDDIPPGPIDRPVEICPDEPKTFKGPWFSEYGAGPFVAIQDLEAWCNHKLDVCLYYKRAFSDTPCFELKEGLVLTHQDISPRNLVLGPRAAGDSSGDDFDL